MYSSFKISSLLEISFNPVSPTKHLTLGFRIFDDSTWNL
jgi:hypothetical protein